MTDSPAAFCLKAPNVVLIAELGKKKEAVALSAYN